MSEMLEYRVNATVDRAFRHPRGSFTVYRVIIEKSSQALVEERMLFKRYSDFKRLHKSLQRVVKELDYGTPLPSLPKETFFNRLDPEVVESRRVFLDALLKVICSKEWLFCHQTFAKFIVGAVVRKTALLTCAPPTVPPQDIPNDLLHASLTDGKLTSPIIPSANHAFSCSEQRSSPPIERTSKPDLKYLLSPASSSDEEREEEEIGTDVLRILWTCSPPSSTDQASGLRRVREAGQFFSAGRWSDAYMAYKSAVADLSSALQSEMCSEKRQECRQIIAACLNRAEDLYNRYLLRSTTPATRSGAAADGIKEAWLSRTCHKTLSSLCQDSRLLERLKPKEYLKELRVCRIEGTQLVVRHLNDRALEYCLEPLHLTSYHDNCSPPPTMTTCAAPTISRPNGCILPLDAPPFMLQLCNIIETQECVFLLTERARGPRFFDWFQQHIERQFVLAWRNSCLELIKKQDNTAAATDNAGIRHIAWCRLRSARIRGLLKSAANVCDSGVKAGHDTPQSPLPDLLSTTRQSDVGSCLPKPLTGQLQVVSGTERIDATVPSKTVTFERLELPGTVTPADLLQFHPFYPSRMLKASRLTRGLSLDRDRCSLSAGTQSQKAALEGTSEFLPESSPSPQTRLCARRDQASPNGSWIPFIPERQLRSWAAELVYAVCWLHERGVILRTLCRSDVYLGAKGRLKLRYFYAWPGSNLAHRGAPQSQSHSPSRPDYSLAPELRLGVSMHHLLVEQSQHQSSACRISKRALFACDWWSVGVLLYELFTGLGLTETHPTGLFGDAHLDLPPHLPSSLHSLLSLLISFDHTKRPSDEEVKSHPFFKDVDWRALSNNNS